MAEQKKTFIVKVQQSQYSSNGLKSIFVYDEKRDHLYETSNQDEVKPVLEILKNRPKAYFHAELNKENKVVILKEAETQIW